MALRSLTRLATSFRWMWECKREVTYCNIRTVTRANTIPAARIGRPSVKWFVGGMVSQAGGVSKGLVRAGASQTVYLFLLLKPCGMIHKGEFHRFFDCFDWDYLGKARVFDGIQADRLGLNALDCTLVCYIF